MKRIVILLLTLCLLSTLCLLVTSCGGDEEGGPEGWQNVAAENAGFKLYVPESWLSQANSGVSGARYGNNDDNSNVTVTRYVPASVGEGKPEVYWLALEQSYTEQFSKFAMDESCVKTDEEGKKTTVGLDAKLGGLDAKKYVYTMTFGGVDYKQMQVICQYHNGDVYIFTYTAKPEFYDKHLEDVATMLTAFRYG